MMNYWGGTNYYNFTGMKFGMFGLLIPLVILDLILRGYALWKSARKDQNIWFVALLLINSVGVLPIIYLLINRDQTKSSKKLKKI